MGRPPKYANDDERHQARKRSRREYYARNIDRERKGSLNRWHRRKEPSPGPQEANMQPEIVLSSTATLLGPMLAVKTTTPLRTLATCLRFDLAAWRDLTPETQKWSELTEGLIALQRSRRPPHSLLRSIEQVKLLAIVVQDVAHDGVREAERRGPQEETGGSLLSSIASEASVIIQSSQELENLFNRGGSILKSSFKQGALYWQCG